MIVLGGFLLHGALVRPVLGLDRPDREVIVRRDDSRRENVSVRHDGRGYDG